MQGMDKKMTMHCSRKEPKTQTKSSCTRRKVKLDSICAQLQEAELFFGRGSPSPPSRRHDGHPLEPGCRDQGTNQPFQSMNHTLNHISMHTRYTHPASRTSRMTTGHVCHHRPHCSQFTSACADITNSGAAVPSGRWATRPAANRAATELKRKHPSAHSR